MQEAVDDQQLVIALRSILADMHDVAEAAIVEVLGLYLQGDEPDPQFGFPVEVLAVGTASAGPLVPR